jgi:hypothetical protein
MKLAKIPEPTVALSSGKKSLVSRENPKIAPNASTVRTPTPIISTIFFQCFTPSPTFRFSATKPPSRPADRRTVPPLAGRALRARCRSSGVGASAMIGARVTW